MSHIKNFITDDLREMTEPEIIMSNLKTLYGTLCKTKSRKTESEFLSYLGSFDIPKLSKDERIYVKEN